jgi:hypothetical protein
MEAGFGPRAAEHASELAMHYSRAHAHERALHFHELAAGAALDRHAGHEAVAHLTAALDALRTSPRRTSARAASSRSSFARATLLMAIRGYAAAETEHAFARARALCDALPAEPALHPVLRGMVSYHQVRAEFDQALAVGDAAPPPRRRPARRSRAPRASALRTGHDALPPGRARAAREHLEAALREYDPAAHQWHALLYGGYDPGVACAMWLAWTLAMQGELGCRGGPDARGRRVRGAPRRRVLARVGALRRGRVATVPPRVGLRPKPRPRRAHGSPTSTAFPTSSAWRP